jgi:hypothetical protein
MNICGVSLSGAVATLAMLETTNDGFGVIDCETTRVELGDGDNAQAVKSFRDAFAALVRDHQISLIAIKKRNTGGPFTGGAMTFKMEGLIQCIDVEVQLVAAITIARCVDRNGYVLPERLHKYQKGGV